MTYAGDTFFDTARAWSRAAIRRLDSTRAAIVEATGHPSRDASAEALTEGQLAVFALHLAVEAARDVYKETTSAGTPIPPDDLDALGKDLFAMRGTFMHWPTEGRPAKRTSLRIDSTGFAVQSVDHGTLKPTALSWEQLFGAAHAVEDWATQFLDPTATTS